MKFENKTPPRPAPGILLPPLPRFRRRGRPRERRRPPGGTRRAMSAAGASVNVSCRRLRLPLPRDAQDLPVEKVAGLFSPEDVAQVLDLLSASADLGRDTRNLDGSWETHYLHTGHLFQRRLPHLRERLLQAARDADARCGWGLLADRRQLNLRVVEVHSVSPGGGLADWTHLDFGSLITLDVMLADPRDDFSGGAFTTLEKDGRVERHRWERRGDAVIFPSHKYHAVTPVTRGLRRVLVAEVWDGDERSCPHRCSARADRCDFSLQRSERKVREGRGIAAIAADAMRAAGDAERQSAREMLRAVAACGGPVHAELVVDAASQQWEFVLVDNGWSFFQRMGRSRAERRRLLAIEERKNEHGGER